MRPTRLLWAIALSLLIHLGAALGLRGLGFYPRPLRPLVVELVAPVVAKPTPGHLTETAAPRVATARRPPHSPRATHPAPPAGGREVAARPAPTETPAEAPPASTHGVPPTRSLEPEERLVLSRAPSAPAPAPQAAPAPPPRPSVTSLDRLVASAPVRETSESPPTASTEAVTPSPGTEVQVSPSVPSPPAPSRLTALARGSEPRGAIAVPPAPRRDSNRVRDGGGGEPGAGEAPARPGGGGGMDRPRGLSHEVIGEGAGRQGIKAKGSGGDSTRLAVLPGGSREVGGAPSEYRPYLEAFRRKVQESLVYPSAALRRQLQGTVRLEVRLRETGEVAGVGLLHSSGHAILDEVAVRTVEAAGPFPFPAGLRPRPLTIHLPIVFELR